MSGGMWGAVPDGGNRTCDLRAVQYSHASPYMHVVWLALIDSMVSVYL